MSGRIRGLTDLKTGQKARIRSMPEASGKNYLDIFVMTKEKERMEKELMTVRTRKRNLEAGLRHINREIEKAEGDIGKLEEAVVVESIPLKDRKNEGKRAPKKPLKTMALDY